MAAAGNNDEDLFKSAQTQFGERVRAARQARGKSLESLAEGSALHWSFVSRVERGQGNVTLKSLLRLSAALEVDPGALVAGLPVPDVP